jgi:hypothetical protein
MLSCPIVYISHRKKNKILHIYKALSYLALPGSGLFLMLLSMLHFGVSSILFFSVSQIYHDALDLWFKYIQFLLPKIFCSFFSIPHFPEFGLDFATSCEVDPCR